MNKMIKTEQVEIKASAQTSFMSPSIITTLK